MKLTTTLSILGILLIPVLGSAQGYDVEAAMREAAKLQAQYGKGQQAPTTHEMPDVKELTDGDVTRLIETMTQLKKLDIKMDHKGAQNGPAQAMQALAGNQKAMTVIKKNRFTTEPLHDRIAGPGDLQRRYGDGLEGH